jgi:Tfp pilus assembly protein PilV
MEPAVIMVLVLCAGVLALLVWFEINSRRNEASKKQAAKLAQSAVEPLQKEDQSKAGSEIEKGKAA